MALGQITFAPMNSAPGAIRMVDFIKLLWTKKPIRRRAMIERLYALLPVPQGG
jgi:hypothetical protein